LFKEFQQLSFVFIANRFNSIIDHVCACISTPPDSFNKVINAVVGSIPCAV
jgi:hypothetical protein